MLTGFTLRARTTKNINRYLYLLFNGWFSNLISEKLTFDLKASANKLIIRMFLISNGFCLHKRVKLHAL
jgi:hypothetical protein